MFVTIEGIEGSGKGTLIQYLEAWLAEQGKCYFLTREPGGSSLGQTLRGVLLDARTQVTPLAELFLYLADRAQHVEEVIKPRLAQGMVVISDRYVDSTIAYQGFGRGLDVDRLIMLNDTATSKLEPDITLLLDLPVAEGLGRARERNHREGKTVTEGRFEAEALEFHERIRQGYLTLATKNALRYRIVNATQSPAQVFADAVQHLESSLR